MYIGGKEAYISRVTGMLRAAVAAAVITSDDLYGYINAGAEAAGVKIVLTHTELSGLPESMTKLNGFNHDDVAYIQYSSGSTSEPKGVLISQKAIMANGDGILRDGLKITPQDRAFSWLPLYHDMGLVGFCVAPMLGQVTVDYMATTAFARRPALWLKLMSENKSTVSYSPTFGYDLAAKRINGDASMLDLSSWRIAGIGGDMVRPEVLNQFASTLAQAGFDGAAFLPSYGMAESTLAISFCEVGTPLQIDTITRKSYKQEGRAEPAEPASDPRKVRSFVVCGKPLPGHTVEVRDENGSLLPERHIGRVYVDGPSLMSGYFKKEEATGKVLGSDGFLDTGDMGYLLNGAIVVTGRAKDLMLHNGRNIWPQDIEWAAEKVPPLKSGDVAAFAIEGDDGDDEVVVLVECRLADSESRNVLSRNISKTIHQSAGVDCRVILVPPRSLPFTSSGKLSRAAARQKFLDGEIVEISENNASLFLQAAQ
jgi:fatty-acyl-CoA synthase